ncbi:MAG: chlorite dismutase [Armatimonadetes bacterium]|nr:chlorite dismutase [Armatimonadota bacterium]
MAERQLNLYTTYSFTQAYFSLNEADQKALRKRIVDEVSGAAEATFLYSIFPTRPDSDFLIWSAWGADEESSTHVAFEKMGTVVQGLRTYIQPMQTLWGFTRVSMYARGKSEQDMDPYDAERSMYFIAYPFAKTKEWYLMSMDARQGQMNEHMKLGKQYPEIKQLLLYSFGLQDHEFVVAYETNILPKFSDLVRDLRSTEARRHTAMDAPIIVGMYQTPEAFVR